MRLITALAAAFLFAACTPAPPSDPPAAAAEAPAFGFGTRAVLSGEAADTLARQCSRISPGPVEDQWLPDAVEVDAFDAALAPRLATELAASSRSGAAPADYYRQFAGYFIGGKRIIYVNGVHREAIRSDDADFDWRIQPIQICDGGAITFGAEFDPATGEISNFAFNGGLGG